MEGPSLVIATEEFEKYLNRPIQVAEGTAKLPFADMQNSSLREVRSWGKHFLLVFDDFALRIHFLMFGSYRINNPREGRTPKLGLRIDDDMVEFYSCAIKVIEPNIDEQYDWSIDLMSKEWKPKKALAAVQNHPKTMVCDILMDQAIFAGLGNIMKNETLFNLRLHPEVRVGKLNEDQQKALVKEARAYARQFYKWKKEGILKKNWQVFRKKTCPICERKVTKKPTGVGKRYSHFCSNCQLKA